MITVTGATGLLGSRLLFDLATAGHSIRALKRKSSNIDYVRKVFDFYAKTKAPLSGKEEMNSSLFDKIEWLDFDIMDLDSVIEVLEGTTHLYHTAAFVSFNPGDKKEMLKCNIKGTANIVNASLELKIDKLCHVSSTAALGSVPEGEMVTEDSIWTPGKINTAYSYSKFRSEMEVWRGIEEGLNAVIVNPSVIFGPGYWGKGSSSMFTTIQKGLRYYITGVTGFVSVNDVSACMIQLMNSDIKGERFIISSENLCYKDVFGMIATSLQVPPPRTEATPFLSGIAWRLDALRGIFTGKRLITHENIQAGRNKSYFSNEKIKKTLDIEFEKIPDVIQYVSTCRMNQQL